MGMSACYTANTTRPGRERPSTRSVWRCSTVQTPISGSAFGMCHSPNPRPLGREPPTSQLGPAAGSCRTTGDECSHNRTSLASPPRNRSSPTASRVRTPVAAPRTGLGPFRIDRMRIPNRVRRIPHQPRWIPHQQSRIPNRYHRAANTFASSDTSPNHISH
jgi:hypothetical protein